MHSDAFSNSPAASSGVDKFTIKFIGKGVVQITTDPISPVNHASAGDVIDAITKNAGGAVTVEARTNRPMDGHHHHAETEQLHQHETNG